MGTQDEYLHNFTVLLTEKGIVPLTDPMQIAVYNELCSGSKRPSDISAALGIPSSSLHFVLDKMSDAGIIVRSKPDPEKKSVFYSNLALKIAGSTAPAEDAEQICEETFRDPARYYSGMSAVANMLDSYTAEIGLSLDQLRGMYASDLADSMRYDIGTGSLEDMILEIKKRFAESTGFKFSVFSLTPLTLVFEGDRVMSGKMDMLTKFVRKAIVNATGTNYEIASVEDFSNPDTARFKVVYQRAEPKYEPYINMSLPQSQEVSRFMMMELDGIAGIVTSPVQIDIVDAVYERPLCVTDIVNKVEAPRSTVTSNILRMVEDGVLSVFYSESGSAYYGLSCSILMKKSRGLNRDQDETRAILSSVKSKPGAFMEGFLLYTLSSLKGMGFDTDYMMVVLGAKYMRVAGHDDPRSFDVFFGKMSGIAQAIGLSLNVVSVYPLTIGIVSNDPESEMSPAMTFVKGMAHQGLEMASNGIFVRVSDDNPADRKVAFKEIYPALSMTPLQGTVVEGLAEEAPVKKKRTSSVKTALLNRSANVRDRPVRTVRYITGVALMMMLAAVIVFGLAGGDGNNSSADHYSVDLADGCDGVMFYDDDGNEMSMPLTVSTSETVEFTVEYLGGTQNLGVVKNGVAYPIDDYLQQDANGNYMIAASENLTFIPIFEMSMPSDDGLSISLYCFDSVVSESYAYSFGGYIPADAYAEKAGGMWVTSWCAVMVTADDGLYVRTVDSSADIFYFDSIVCVPDEASGMKSGKIPSDFITITLLGDFEADGWFVTGELKVSPQSVVSLKFVSTDGPVSISLVSLGGIETVLDLSSMDRTVTFRVGSDDVVLKYLHVGII